MREADPFDIQHDELDRLTEKLERLREAIVHIRHYASTDDTS